MAVTTGTALLGAAALSAGAGAYSANQQAKAAKASGGQQIQPTAWESMPLDQQNAFLQSLSDASYYRERPDLFMPAPITSQQQQAIDYFANAAKGITPEQFATGLETYANPYGRQVLDNALNDMGNAYRVGSNNFNSLFGNSGFGSSAHTLGQAQMVSDYERNAGNLSAAVNASGFESAADKFLKQMGINAANNATLWDMGGTLQNQATATQRAPLEASNYLAKMAQGIPVAQSSSQPITPGQPIDYGKILQTAGNTFGTLYGAYNAYNQPNSGYAAGSSPWMSTIY